MNKGLQAVLMLLLSIPCLCFPGKTAWEFITAENPIQVNTKQEIIQRSIDYTEEVRTAYEEAIECKIRQDTARKMQARWKDKK